MLATLLLVSIGPIFAQKEDNTAKFPVRLSIPPSASLSLVSAGDSSSSTKGNINQQVISPNSISKTWLNYSSIVESGSTNVICVSMIFGDLPAEVEISVKAGPDAGAGQGKVGTPSDMVILSDYPQAIITNIGTCFTGQGANKGHLLTYNWKIIPDINSESLTKEDIKNLRIGVLYTFMTGE